MRRTTATIAALAAALAGAPAIAQDSTLAGLARELERKARAGERDNGFCAGAARRLERLDRAAAAQRLNRLLSRNDAAPASLLFVVADAPSGEPVCALLAFQPVAMRQGQKCRAAQAFACDSGQVCRARLDDEICEQKPGQWD
jgi:hypothetical protein